MRNSVFRFKRFSVRDEFSAHKVGTDGVLIGAWGSSAALGGNILDIGSGSGLIALMCAQRNPGSVIHAVEIDTPSCDEARRNIENSPWKNRIKVFNASLQNFAAVSNTIYDLIVSNPPYFNTSGRGKKTSRSKARQTFSLSHSELIECVAKVISPEGFFSCIIPYDAFEAFNAFAKEVSLKLVRRCDVLSTPNSSPVRVLLEYSKNSSGLLLDSIVIEQNGRHNYSEKYKELTKDFYFNF